MPLTNRYPLPIAQTNPRSPVTEAYRTVRTNIQFAGVVQDTNVVLVTSSQSSEGKTSTASNLAVVSAQAGKRVLLIDADLRKPQMHHRFQISNLYGLSSVLIRDSSLPEAALPTSIDNLWVLPSGPIPPNPSEMLASPAFTSLIEDCCNAYDMLIIDSPPVLAVADALILTRCSDGVLFVVDSQSTNRGQAQKAVASLQQVNARILGVVLNRLSRKGTEGYYYYYYYGQNAEASAKA